MNKTNNLIKFLFITKILQPRWLITFILLCQLPLWNIYQFSKITQGMQIQTTVYHILLLQFGLYTNIFLILIPIYVILISDIINDGGLEQFLLIRMKDINSWIKYKIKSLFICTFIYLSMSFILCFTISFFSLPKFADYRRSSHIGDLILNGHFAYFNKQFIDVQPYIVIGYMFVFLLMSMFSLGLIILFSSLYFKCNAIPLIIGAVLNIINLILLRCDHLFNNLFLLPYKKILLQFQNNNLRLLDINSIAFSVLYWIIIICILVFIIFIKAKNKNFIFEVDTNE